MLAVYIRAPAFYTQVPHPKAWMYNCFNRDRRAFMASVKWAATSFSFHTQLAAREGTRRRSRKAKRVRRSSARAALPSAATFLSFLTWTAGHALVAEGMQRGRVFLGGDAAHLFTPTGGSAITRPSRTR